jgi:hypothetical protein
MLFLTILFSITPAKAAFSSFVLPGSGDLLMGDKSRGICFMVAEAAIWLNYFNSNAQGEKKGEISRNFAAYYAAANLDNQDEDYLDAMEDFLTNMDYNEYVKEEARRMYPDTLDSEVMLERVESRRQYIEENSYTGSAAWDWGSLEIENKYRDIRKEKRSFEQMATNMVGLAVANRVVSLFTTYFFGKRVSVEIKENEIEMGFNF